MPENESQITLLAYTIQDNLLAKRFEQTETDLTESMIDWLVTLEAVAYLSIERYDHSDQAELPFPVGREPMDRLTHTAATREEFEILTYLMESKPHLDACKLHLAKRFAASRPLEFNLLAPVQLIDFKTQENLSFEFAS